LGPGPEEAAVVGFVTIAALVAVTVGFCAYYIRSSGVEHAAPRRRGSTFGGIGPDTLATSGLDRGCDSAGGAGWSGGGGDSDAAGGLSGDGGGRRRILVIVDRRLGW
jgi:hypothetical protein